MEEYNNNERRKKQEDEIKYDKETKRKNSKIRMRKGREDGVGREGKGEKGS
jgi:hypothetical protein